MQQSHIPVSQVSQDPLSKPKSPSTNMSSLMSSVLLLAMAITFVGIYGTLRTDIGGNSGSYPSKYVSFVEVSLAGAIIGMLGLLLALIDHYAHHKALVFVVVGLMSIAWILVFAGMILAADYVLSFFKFQYVDPYKGIFIGMWFIYSFMVFHAFMNMYWTLKW